MPVGKPTDDGEIILGSRHGTHKGGLGTLLAWDCPACGTKNEGRRPELGCQHCGSGDPTKSTAGGVQDIPAARHGERRPVELARDVVRPTPERARPEGWDLGAPPTVIYRLIEYVMSDAPGGQEALRRSLIGTMTLPWGRITGTIVDSLDSRQEDLLRMARMQPGVWVGNATVLNPTGASDEDHEAFYAAHRERLKQRQLQRALSPDPDPLVNQAVEELVALRRKPMDAPDTGPAFSDEELNLAQALLHLVESNRAGAGLPFIHTLALALSNVAMELEGNMEPLKFMESAACSRLANALMSLIPSDWDPQEEKVDAD